MDSIDGEGERKRAIERAVTCHREDCFPGPLAFILQWVSASAEDKQVIHRSPAQSYRIS